MEKIRDGDEILDELLSRDVAYIERAVLAKQYIEEISILLEMKRMEGEVIYWKDLPWVVQFLPVISYFYDDRELINYLNPCPEVGGMSGLIGYSKEKLHAKFPARYMPRSLFFEGRPDTDDVFGEMRDNEIDFPVFCKPDKGERAAFVKRIASVEELEEYLAEFPAHNSLIVQVPAGAEWEDRYEYGVQVVRNPVSDLLEITSAELKSVPFVVGDGEKSVEELVEGLDGLTDLQRGNVLGDLSVVEKKLVPEKNEKVKVVHAASVSRGTSMVTLEMEFAGSELESALREVLSGFDNFSSGRFDLVSYSEDGLQGGNFEIIEGNAGAAIPLQVYRSDLDICEVYQILFEHFLRLKCNAVKNRDRYIAGEISDFEALSVIKIASQLMKGILQQRSQWKNLSSAGTREMFNEIMKNTRLERWALRRAKIRAFLGKVLER